MFENGLIVRIVRGNILHQDLKPRFFEIVQDLFIAARGRVARLDRDEEDAAFGIKILHRFPGKRSGFQVPRFARDEVVREDHPHGSGASAGKPDRILGRITDDPVPEGRFDDRFVPFRPEHVDLIFIPLIPQPLIYRTDEIPRACVVIPDRERDRLLGQNTREDTRKTPCFRAPRSRLYTRACFDLPFAGFKYCSCLLDSFRRDGWSGGGRYCWYSQQPGNGSGHEYFLNDPRERTPKFLPADEITQSDLAVAEGIHHQGSIHRLRGISRLDEGIPQE
ncbi:MAG: hypothetical protein BWY49_00454 [Candidatus Omnitrophica bacterium ADurb.Bin314]|nr:MAG: hypothetical protein BWY49_00454 [Candidatus Omnitrophica bacterium ADurb.Bin314]